MCLPLKMPASLMLVIRQSQVCFPEPIACSQPLVFQNRYSGLQHVMCCYCVMSLNLSLVCQTQCATSSHLMFLRFLFSIRSGWFAFCKLHVSVTLTGSVLTFLTCLHAPQKPNCTALAAFQTRLWCNLSPVAKCAVTVFTALSGTHSSS